jgi:sec-independent protein translocase protein TatC
VYPAALDFLIGYGEQFRPMVTIGEYTDLFLTVILGLGLVFELPVVIFFLALMGVVDAGFLWQNFRYAILGAFTVAAILTPTTDVVNMGIFAAPLIVLYVLSIGIAWAVNPRRRARAAA